MPTMAKRGTSHENSRVASAMPRRRKPPPPGPPHPVRKWWTIAPHATATAKPTRPPTNALWYQYPLIPDRVSKRKIPPKHKPRNAMTRSSGETSSRSLGCLAIGSVERRTRADGRAHRAAQTIGRGKCWSRCDCKIQRQPKNAVHAAAIRARRKSTSAGLAAVSLMMNNARDGPRDAVGAAHRGSSARWKGYASLERRLQDAA
jgi:hypothetical protein